MTLSLFQGHFSVFGGLPFVLQMRIAEYFPNVPHILKKRYRVLRYHFDSRFCVSCGKILPKWHEKYICCCRQKYRHYKFQSPERMFQFFERPFYIFSQYSIPLSIFQIKMYENAVNRRGTFFVSSNQPEFLYCFSSLWKESYEEMQRSTTKKLCRRFVRKFINGHTCLHTYLDSFCFDRAEKEYGISFLSCFGKKTTRNRIVYYQP